jgi:ketosteroid isomerase-like protein
MESSERAIGCALFLGAMTACTPPDTRQGDIQAVKNIEAAWSKDAGLKDPAKMASYYSAVEAIALFPNSPPVTGRNDIQGVWTTLMRDPNFALSFNNTKADASKAGDLVYTVGTYTLTTSNPQDKQPITDKGKYMTVYKKQADGSWKAVADMINSDLPARGAAH